jgi:hypothetical protein
MGYDILSVAAHGFLSLPWWGYIVVTLVLTHITIASVTIFLHRARRIADWISIRWPRTFSVSGSG